MKIVNVTPGLIQIPPNGWGAIEKIIWELHLNLLKEGHTSEITYLDDVPNDADIVHIHVANLANMAHERGIPYYFTMHDHHAYLYGKDSDLYKENLQAMKNSIQSFVPAQYLVEYFDGIPEYFSHGVNTLEFYPPTYRKQHKLLCVANNGYAYDQSVDRKGFGIAIEAARGLGLPITIAGPSNNKHYFEKNPPTYNKLTILYDLTETELRKLYQEHTIFVHPSELEAGHPNLTLLEAMASGLPVVGTYEKGNSLKGMITCSRNVAHVEASISNIIYEYQQYKTAAREQAEQLSWNARTKEFIKIYSRKPTDSMKDKLLHHYKTTVPVKMSVKPKINFNNINGLFVEVLGGPATRYDINLINKSTNQSVYKTTVDKNCWVRASAQYYVDWKIVVEDINSKVKFTYELSLKDKRVYISLDSKSLGDTLAWIPYVEEFRKQHNCKVICSTFWNNLFIDEYPLIEFTTPGEVVNNIIAQYNIGLFYTDDGKPDSNKHTLPPTEGPLQKIATDILGLPFTEIRPKIKQRPQTKTKQVCIAIHSTAQSKYWNNPTGWQDVVDWLNAQGYTVKLLSQEHDGYMGNKNPTGVIQHPQSSIENVISELKKSDAFIGVSSGLTWVSWATGIPTVLISGFTDPINEMEDCVRISAPTGKCSGCWSRHKFNPGDWNWCPDQKGTPRQFECSKEITSEMVITELQKLLSKPSPDEYTKSLLKNYSTWDEHGKFAIDLVTLLNPTTIVDLGIDTGYSTFCFAYPNKGTVYGIDSFEGDIFSGFRDTLSTVTQVRADISKYGINNVQIIKGYFDDVVKTWSKQIDLLHIDGLHTYEAVSNDFNKWSPFCSDEAVILFHDIDSFKESVGKFFSELDGYKLERRESFGLGIYTKSKEQYERIKKLLAK